MITEDYCSFEVAKLLKEKGFPQEYDIYHSMVYNEEDYEDEYEVQRMVLQTRLVKAGTLSSYPVGVPEPKCYCPTHQMAMKWLRTKGIVIVIGYDEVPKNLALGEFYWVVYQLQLRINPRSDNSFKTYEEAVEDAIKYCLINLI